MANDRREPAWRLSAKGVALGTLTWLAAVELLRGVVGVLDREWLVPVAAVAGALLGRSRLMWMLWIAATACVLGIGVIGFTPLLRGPVHDLARGQEDPPARTDAVVVLAASVTTGGDLTADSKPRLTRGLEEVAQGRAPRLVLTHHARRASWTPAARRQMQALGIDVPVLDAGPALNTRDEAIGVARLARERRWRRVTLVTDALHMRRAALTFRKAGVEVLRAPSDNLDYDFEHVDTLRGRLRAWRLWSHEVVGLYVYRRRGWI
ncbi:MAG TPA: YdcF family protein [Chthonomonadales bacterium]|nr:YdcF family protein [Chthonomonadales bacterium]